jgi:hypothetical protein
LEGMTRCFTLRDYCDIPRNKVFFKFKICWENYFIFSKFKTRNFLPFMEMSNFEFDNYN